MWTRRTENRRHLSDVLLVAFQTRVKSKSEGEDVNCGSSAESFFEDTSVLFVLDCTFSFSVLVAAEVWALKRVCVPDDLNIPPLTVGCGDSEFASFGCGASEGCICVSISLDWSLLVEIGFKVSTEVDATG